jgi:hypothetical protein
MWRDYRRWFNDYFLPIQAALSGGHSEGIDTVRKNIIAKIEANDKFLLSWRGRVPVFKERIEACRNDASLPGVFEADTLVVQYQNMALWIEEALGVTFSASPN